MDWIDSDRKSMFGGPCGFVWEKSGAGGLGIFITHSLAARRIEVQYQENNRKCTERKIKSMLILINLHNIH